ncbi:MAG: hypothetical protein AAGD96_11315, partial [Chloroflexota bacterium]
MTPLVISIAAGVTIGLSEVATGLVTETIMGSAVGPTIERIRSWLSDKQLARQRDQEMQAAVVTAIEAISNGL